MKEKIILICGGSGMIGQALSVHLNSLGYTIRILTRFINSSIHFDQYLWDPNQGTIDLKALDGVHGVINLSGSSIGKERWTAKRKQELIDSRIISTQFIIRKINALTIKPKVFISSSAIGIYENQPDKVNENTPVKSADFLSMLCIQWEAEVESLHDSIRQVILRIGLVLSIQNGILAESILPARYGVVPIFGSGAQFYSWIHIQDLVHIICSLLNKDDASGIYNASANHPVSQKVLAQALAHCFHARTVSIYLPKWIMRMALGEFSESLYSSQYVIPQRLNEMGFPFKYDTLSTALKDLLNR